MKLPATDITVAHRSDGSGTTYIFVDYLSKVSPEFKKKVGVATSVNWPVGVGGKGNEGVAGLVKQTPGAIGYVELDLRACRTRSTYGAVQNMDGEFVTASPRVGHGGRRGRGQGDARRISASRSRTRPGKGAYPISSFTWLLLLREPEATRSGPRSWSTS